MNPLARHVVILRALADRKGLCPLQPTLFGDRGAHLGTVLFQDPGDPVTNPGKGQHLPVIERRERAAIVKEPADLTAQRHRGLLHLVPARFVNVIGRPIARREAHLPEVRQMPIEMPQLASHAGIREHRIAGRVLLAQHIGVMRHPQKAKPRDDGIEGIALPMAGEFLELGVEIVKGIVGGIQRLDIACRVQLLHILRVRQDHIIGARGRLRDQTQHIVAAGVVFRRELDVVLFLEGAHDVGLCMAIPGQHRQVDGLRRGPDGQEGRGQRGPCGHFQQVAAGGGFQGHVSLHVGRYFYLIKRVYSAATRFRVANSVRSAATMPRVQTSSRMSPFSAVAFLGEDSVPLAGVQSGCGG